MLPQDPTKIAIDFDPTVHRMKGIARHGNTPFDVPFISEIAPNLWHFIEHVVSLYPWEAYILQEMPRTYLEVAMYDSEDQGYQQVDELATWVNSRRKDGPTLVHCQAGLNRSSLVAARALMLDGMTADEAITLIRDQRSVACLCNPAFERWLRSL